MSTKKYPSKRIKNKDVGLTLTEIRLSKEDKFPNFCKIVKKLRLENGLTQAELAERAGIHQSKISGIEKGTFPKDEDRIIALADALDVSLDVLFGRDRE